MTLEQKIAEYLEEWQGFSMSPTSQAKDIIKIIAKHLQGIQLGFENDV